MLDDCRSNACAERGTLDNNVTRGQISKSGSDRGVVTSISTYSGGTTISGGTLTTMRIRWGPGLLPAAACFQVGGARLEYAFHGTGSLVKPAQARLTLSGDNSYSSGTTHPAVR